MWIAVALLMGRATSSVFERGGVVDSTVERFGLLTIIVLGEVVVGVVEGLSESHRDLLTMTTAFFALIVGFGLWWNYFDWAGRRLPAAKFVGGPLWMVFHLPLTLSIAASGAAMVGLIEHSADAHAPATSTWLLTGAIALGFVSSVVIIRTLEDYDRRRGIYGPIAIAMLVAAGGSLAVGYWQPSPLVLMVVLAAIQSAVWFVGVWRLLATDEDPGSGLDQTAD